MPFPINPIKLKSFMPNFDSLFLLLLLDVKYFLYSYILQSNSAV